MRKLLVALLVLLPGLAQAQFQYIPPASAAGGDVAVQANFCGPDATTNVEIGSCANDANAGASGTNVVIGDGASNSGTSGNVIIGAGATHAGSNADQVVIGAGAATGVGGSNSSVIIGRSAACGAASAVTIGKSASCGGNFAIALGVSATAAANTFVAGSNGSGVLDVYFGEGIANTTAAGWTLHGTGGSGADNPGGNLTVAGGIGTGTARGGDYIEQTSPAISTGSTAQTLETRTRVVAKQFALTDNTIATFATMALGNGTGGGLTLQFCIKAADATNQQMECGEVSYTGVDTTAGAGGEVCTVSTGGVNSESVSGATTLTVTFAASTGTDLCNLRVTADTSIATPTTLWLKYTITHNSGQVITPQ